MPTNQYKFSLVIGNILEWYDFALYGFFAHILATIFFPQLDHTAALLATFGGFTVGFVMRPVGGWLLGQFGDRYGKKQALILSLSLMFFPALAMTLMPTYHAIGLWAPTLLLLARLLQGFSSGGEIAAVTYSLVEAVPDKHKNRSISFSLGSAYLGVALAAFICFILTDVSQSDFLTHYAWRIGFGFGAILSVSGLILRYRVFMKQPLIDPGYLKKKQKNNLSVMLKTIMIIAPGAFINYFLIIYVPNMLVSQHRLPISTAILGVIVILLIVLITMWVLQTYLKQQSTHTFMSIVTGLLFICAWPILHGLVSNHWPWLLLSLLCLSVFFGCYAMPMVSATLSLFSKQHRLKSFGISYNLVYVIFGSTAPLISHALLPNINLLALYIMTLSLIAIIGNYLISEDLSATF